MSTAEQVSAKGSRRWLQKALGLSEEDTPFPWQEELLTRFSTGSLVRSIDIPTGLGKTAVMAIWLVSRALGAALPRRLVYVVDRRAVVDQATEIAQGLREFVDRNPELKQALGLERRSLPISTLRGQYVDNKEWLEDPASPAIIVGTVDMVGSRLLFEGYGVSRKMRPYHAGLLGVDTLVVVDEAHLVPPFEKLLETMAEGGSVLGPRDDRLRQLVPPFKLLSLSATGRGLSSGSFALGEVDLKHPVVQRRLFAPKHLAVLPLDDQMKLHDALAEQAWKLAGSGTRAVRIIVFGDKRETVVAAKEAIKKHAKGDRKTGIQAVEVDTELFVAGRRVFERGEAAKRLGKLGFIPGPEVPRTRPAFLFATSAGEVGVDLDADHMVCDLVAWERTVQRLGRVNRRGDGNADVVVVAERDPKSFKDAVEKAADKQTHKDKKVIEEVRLLKAVQTLLGQLPSQDGVADASPGALQTLKRGAESDMKMQALLDDATTPVPLRPALSRALVDAWSMTSLDEHTGRPEIEPWLRGWAEDDPPQTTVVWRKYLPVRRVETPTKQEVEEFFEAAPPHASEILETETYRVVEWLAARAKALAAPSSRQGPTPVETGSESKDDMESQETADLGEVEGLDESERPTEGEESAEAANRGTSGPFGGHELVAFVLTPAGDLRTMLRVNELNPSDKRDKEELRKKLTGATVVVDARIGGLADGLLDHEACNRPRTADDGEAWLSSPDSSDPVVRFRVRTVEPGQPVSTDKQWRERFRFATELSKDGEPTRLLLVEKWRHDATTEEDRSAGRPQLLHEHRAWAEAKARDLAERLGLPDEYGEMLAMAARFHDAGKKATRWQRAFNAPTDGTYAKTGGPINGALLDHYRHEFGSLPLAGEDQHLCGLPDELRDLALHLIIAHHGFGRPLIGTGGCDDAPPSALEGRAREIALRFARLQRCWGPWGLAWWEALLRAADQQASRDNDAPELHPTEESQ